MTSPPYLFPPPPKPRGTKTLGCRAILCDMLPPPLKLRGTKTEHTERRIRD